MEAGMLSYPMRTVQVKKLVLELAEGLGNTAKVCHEYRVPRSTFYRWKEAYAKHGEGGLVRKKPIWTETLVSDTLEFTFE